MLFVVALCLSLSVAFGEIAFPRGCDIESVSIAADFIQNHAKYVPTVQCFQKMIQCVGFDVQTPLRMCAKELNMPELNDPAKTLQLLGDSENNYFKALQATCCVKSKESLVNGLSYDALHEAVEKCTDKTCA